MTNTTTGSSILNVEPFIENHSMYCVGPVIWPATKAELKVPVRHDIERTGSVYHHRLVWKDGTGVHVEATMKRIAPGTMRLLYEAAHEKAQDIEAMHHGCISH